MHKRFCEMVGLILLSFVFASVSNADPTDKILFHYKGVPYTCEQMTLLTYKEGLAYVTKAEQAYDPEKQAKPAAGPVPLEPREWAEAPEGDFLALYHKGLNAIIRRFICEQVAAEFVRRYPNDNIEVCYDPTKLEEYIEKASIVLQRDSERFLSRPADAEQLARGKIYRGLVAQCFPYRKNEKIAPWLAEASLWETLIKYHLVEEVEGDKQKYIDKLAGLYGARHGLYFEKALESDKDAILELLETVITKEGRIAELGVQKVCAVLPELGSPTTLDYVYGPREYYLEVYKVPAEDYKERELMEVPGAPPPFHNYLYIVRDELRPLNLSLDARPGEGFLFELAQRELLKPIYEEIIAQMEVGEEFSLPQDDAWNSMGRHRLFPSREFYPELPEVIHADY